MLFEKVERIILGETFKSPLEAVNCQSCQMAIKGIYLEALKCCTYHPFLPNYMVGGILDGSKDGAKIIKDKIEKKIFVLPLGVLPSWAYRQEHKFLNANEYGRNKDLLCPFFNSLEGSCKIWTFRSSVCRSFYCESSWGKEGLKYWELYNEAHHYVEMALTQECLLQFGFEWQEIENQLDYLEAPAHQLNPLNKLSKKIDEELWQHKIQDKIEFFRDCYNYVSSLSQSKLIALLEKEGLDKFTELKEWCNEYL
ncbi:MAG: hypothetical protein KDD58_09505 [Bdellovibrionales bacterium]|nr:hypothetical protein [Bdellovibrionales bacterium]